MDHSYASERVTTTLAAMCQQEESIYRVAADYLNLQQQQQSCPQQQEVDRMAAVAQRRAKCRAAMVTWCCTVVDYLEFERETVSIALNYLDRFMETPQGRACLTTPRQYKIAGMTCLYTAIKTHEPEAIEPDLVVELSGNLCATEDIEAMERTLLSALQWRMNPPTALAFCRHLLSLVPNTGLIRDVAALMDLAQVQTELAVADARLVTTPPSLLALASIFNALESKHSALEILDDLSQLFFVALSDSAHLDMDAVFDVQDILDDIIQQHNQKSASNDDDDDDDDDEQQVEQEEQEVPVQQEEEEDVSEQEEEPQDDDDEQDDDEQEDDEASSNTNPALVDEDGPRNSKPSSAAATVATARATAHRTTPIRVSPSAYRYNAAEAA